MAATGRQTVDSDRDLRRLQNREHGRIKQTPLESAIGAAIKNDNDVPLFRQIKAEVDPDRLLSRLHTLYSIDPKDHTVTYNGKNEPRFKAGSRNLNASDLLTKHFNLEWTETKQLLLDVWDEQQRNVPFRSVNPAVRLTKEQARERFNSLKAHKKTVNSEIYAMRQFELREYRTELRSLHTIPNTREREVERGYIIFKHLVKSENINSIQRACFNEISAVHNHWQPNNRREVDMLGASIVKTLKNQTDENMISNAEPVGIAESIKRARRAQEYIKRELKDLIPHKVSPKEIRYLEPKTGAQVFADTGDTIRLKGEITQDRASVMMEYAKEKYGGVLRLSGTKEFKTACAMAAAEKGMAVILRPDEYQQIMINRLEEIKAEKGIEQNNTVEREQPEAEHTHTEQLQAGQAQSEQPAPEQVQSAGEDIEQNLTENPTETQKWLDEVYSHYTKEEQIEVLSQKILAIDKQLESGNPDTGLPYTQEQTQVLLDKRSEVVGLRREMQAAGTAEIKATVPERDLQKELENLADKYVKELNVSREDAAEAVKIFNIKSLDELDKRMNDPERVASMESTVKQVEGWNKQDRERDRDHGQDNDFSR